MTKIEIDTVLCQASGTCVRLVPAVFEIAEHGEYACVRAEAESQLAGPAHDELLASVHEAEQSCPTGAIMVSA